MANTKLCKCSTIDVDFLKLPWGNGLEFGLRQIIQDELKSKNKRQHAFLPILSMSIGVLSMNGTPLAALILR